MPSPQNRVLFILYIFHIVCYIEFVKIFESFLQSYNKSLINQACSGLSWENIGPWSFLYGPRADILPVRPSCLVNEIYIFYIICLTQYHRSMYNAVSKTNIKSSLNEKIHFFLRYHKVFVFVTSHDQGALFINIALDNKNL